MMRALVRLAAACAMLLALTFAALAAFVAFWSPRELPERAPLILVLGGDRLGTGLGPRSADRLATGLRLYEEGRAPRMHFTGAGAPRMSVAERMALEAQSAGVPAGAITVETLSRSTLQNALFSIDRIGTPPPGTLLVTDAFHLPRAVASFRWAGARGLVPVPSDGFPAEPFAEQARWIARETLAWWFNIARAGAFSALDALGAGRERTLPLLAEAAP